MRYYIFEGKYDKNIFKAVFLVGSPASGKTETYEATLSSKDLKHIDPDKVMSFFVKKDKGSLQDTSSYSKYQDRVKKTLNRLTDGYIKSRLGLVIDGTGRDKNLIFSIKNKLENLGYQTAMVYINTPLERALKKYKERNRAVDKEFLLKAVKDVRKNIPEYKKKFKNFYELEDFSQIKDLNRKINNFLSQALPRKAIEWLKEDNMNIFEELKKAENKKKFRELVMKYHPDKKSGDEVKMKALNNAADKGDSAFENFVNEILSGKKSSENEYETKDFKHINEFYNKLNDLKEKGLIKHFRSIDLPSAIPYKVFIINTNKDFFIQAQYNETEYSPVIDLWLQTNENINASFKTNGKKYHHMQASSVDNAIRLIKFILKNLDNAKKDEDA